MYDYVWFDFVLVFLIFVFVEFIGWGNRFLGGKMWTCRNVSMYIIINYLIKKDNFVRILFSCIGGVFIFWIVMGLKENIFNKS